MHYVPRNVSALTHTKLNIIRILIPRLETICMVLFNDVYLQLTFLSYRSKYLMLFTNIHFGKWNAAVEHKGNEMLLQVLEG